MSSNIIGRFFCVALMASFCMSLGCGPPPQVADKAEDKAEAEAAQAAEEEGDIFGKTTTQITEWDPNAGRQLRKPEGEGMNLINRNLRSLSYATHETARLRFKQGMNLYYAAEGRYPKTFDEFMEKAFKVYIVKLPMPVKTCEYQYDVENHELMIVEK